MKREELQFEYPEELVAIQPLKPSRVLQIQDGEIQETSIAQLIDQIPAGDALVINNTKVLKRRIFVNDLEILFLTELSPNTWQVLFPSKKFKIGDRIELPLGRSIVLKEKGRPQIVESDSRLGEDYFLKVGELPLPPYIQKARGVRNNVASDDNWYQTAWASKAGSFAAPTASLHFSVSDLERLREKGVRVVEITLHVGLGTFLPVTTEDLNDHQMHEEFFEISRSSWEEILGAKHVWALGTTSTRALESFPPDFFSKNQAASFYTGTSTLLIQPGFDFRVVDRLLTNFHQPESTLLALVAGFAGLDTVKRAYQVAISKKFRLFSYGDLSVWIKN